MFFCAVWRFFIALKEAFMLFQNELLIILSLPLLFGCVLLAYRLFGKIGLYAMTPIATILANIEVLMLVEGFGMEQTLGLWDGKACR